jgi:hypothetical protein
LVRKYDKTTAFITAGLVRETKLAEEVRLLIDAVGMRTLDSGYHARWGSLSPLYARMTGSDVCNRSIMIL